jgi:DNA helicase-2/ATP-dependent DNA helicase PcrA
VSAGGDPLERLERFPRPGIATDLATLAQLLRRLTQSDLGPSEQVDEVLRYYDPILKRAYREDHPKRRKDLEQFAVITARYPDLHTLLTDVALEPPADSVGDVLAADPDEGLLTLSTVHSAKGLEWHAVFVIWAADGRFPSVYSLRDDEIEEERRLMYVAATRAKDDLYLTYPIAIFDRGLGIVMGKPSRFIESIPRETLRPVMLVEQS